MLTLKRAALMLSLAAAALTLLSMAASLEPANAATGNTTTAVALGLKYENGHGVPKNYAKALHYFRLAAAQGSAAGEDDLGYMYEHGRGVPQDYATALHWYRLAVAHGNANAAGFVRHVQRLTNQSTHQRAASEHHAISRASRNRMAPADEYFGRYKESILEIRNRLDRFDLLSDDDMLQPGTTHALDDLQNVIRDWQQKYPRDPWVPASLQRLLRDYQRAGAASSPASLEIIALLRSAYPDYEQTSETVASLFGSPETPAADNAPPAVAPDSAPPPSEQDAQPNANTITLQGAVVDAQSGEPIVGAVILVTTDDGTVDASTPFVATDNDGSFSIDGLPASTLQIIVEPPRGSGYAAYRVTVDGSNGDVDAGVITLSVDD
jgi:TPR repeat protein